VAISLKPWSNAEFADGFEADGSKILRVRLSADENDIGLDADKVAVALAIPSRPPAAAWGVLFAVLGNLSKGSAPAEGQAFPSLQRNGNKTAVLLWPDILSIPQQGPSLLVWHNFFML
jgi:hypothetical protein